MILNKLKEKYPKAVLGVQQMFFIKGYIILFATQYIYEKYLFEWSGENIPLVQKDLSEKQWFWWNFLTSIGGGKLQIAYFIAFAAFAPHHADTFILAVGLTVHSFFIPFFKLVHN